MLLVVGPLVVVAGLLWLANRRVSAQLEAAEAGEAGEGDKAGEGGAEAAESPRQADSAADLDGSPGGDPGP